MDPCGPQSKIKGNEYHVAWQKLLDGGGVKSDYKGVLKHEGGKTKHAKSTEQGYREFQCKVKGATKHTYGLDGANDPD